MDEPLRDRLTRAVGRRAVARTPVARGYTLARRWIVRFDDGSSAFAKLATDAETARWLRAEAAVYRALGPRPFLPALRAFDDADGAAPLLVLEDLASACWPPPWTPDHVARVCATLDAVARTPPPPSAPSLEASRDFLTGWRVVSADPAPFLALGLCDRAWLAAALPTLVSAERDAVLDGDALVHFDVRSDNLCLPHDGRRAVLVDWNFAARGNPLLDVAAWLPSLQAEGGPRPDDVLPGHAPLAALISGFFASRAGLPPTPTLSARVRALQRAQLGTALPWAARALGLAAPRAP